MTISPFTDEQRLRVRYDECDSMGITYHARYLDWFVIGRTELLRSLGLPYAQLERSGLLLPVLEANCRYHASTRYDDLVKIDTRLLRLTRTRMDFGYRVFLQTDAAQRADVTDQAVPRPAAVLAAEGETRHAFIDARHRPIDLRKHFPEVWDKLASVASTLREAGR